MTGFLDAARLERALVGTVFSRVVVLDETESTNTDAAGYARGGASAGLVVATGHQRAGRGRFDRSWEAPPDTALALSVLLEPARPLRTGVAVPGGRPRWWSMLTDVAGIPARPQVAQRRDGGERKLCGILSERVAIGDGGLAVVG